jgi:hypothetical protein
MEPPSAPACTRGSDSFRRHGKKAREQVGEVLKEFEEGKLRAAKNRFHEAT